ncbi:hypothetical protein CC80DRAFT_382297, partial [Byssothecium circinans]
GLEALPAELLDMVVADMSFPQKIALRSCSKLLEYNIPLDQAFWRKHMIDGTAVPYLPPLDPKQCPNVRCTDDNDVGLEWDWGGLFSLFSNKSRVLEALNGDPSDSNPLRNLPMPIWNRCRIWMIAE